MGLLIIDARTALQGAVEGIELCIRTVVPSLFPFFVMSILLTGSMTGQKISGLRPIGQLCGVPEGGEALLLVGLVGGYPVGAQSVCQAYRAGQLSERDAKRMLGFCNNAGPAFLFGMTAALFRSPIVPWVLWAIHIFSALITAFLLPGKNHSTVELHPCKKITLPQAVEQAVKIMAGVCGWVVLFRVMITMLRRWCLWLLSKKAQIAITGLLELSNGCCDLANLSGEGLRFLLCACFLGFGGLCVAMQTVSVTSGLGTGAYFPGKVMQGILSFLLAAIAQRFLFDAAEQIRIHPAVWALFLCGGCIGILILKKSSRNPAVAGV